MAVIAKYLQQYASIPDDTIGAIESHIKTYQLVKRDWVLVIPVFDESLQSLQELARQLSRSAAFSKQHVLIIWVFNTPDDCDLDTRNRCLATCHAFKASVLGLQAPIFHWCLDRISIPIPKNQGVGCARKLGADLALYLMHQGWVRYPILLNADADVLIPLTYFNGWQYANFKFWQDQQVVAWYYPFKHIDPMFDHEHTSSAFNKKTVGVGGQFDCYLSYYVASLKAIGSPYAYYALGSILGVEASAYAKVRGFPRISGGEDFYILNKLRKLGRVHQLAANPIHILARISSRVPFGTGPRLKKFLCAESADQGFSVPSPDAFELLKALFDQVNMLPEQATWSDLQAACSLVLTKHPVLAEGMSHVRYQSWIKQCLRQPGQRGVKKRFHDWLDGFHTFKLLNFWQREKAMSDILR